MHDYYGWRARLGLIYPSSSTVMEPEMYAMAPEGVSIHTTRQDIGLVNPEGLKEWVGDGIVEECTRRLAQAPLHSIVLGGTSASFIEGRGWDEKICARMASVSNGIPVTTATTAARSALMALGISRLSFVTAYTDEVNRCGETYLKEYGFEITSSAGMGLTYDPDISAVPAERVYELVRRSVNANADGVFISCTGLRSVGVIATLEEDLGIPVISSNQACFWHALQLSGVRVQVTGFGKLMAINLESDQVGYDLKDVTQGAKGL